MYLFKKTVFNCHQATLLSLKKEEGKISLFERVKLSYHLFYCTVCKRFVEQSHQINHIGKSVDAKLLSHPPYTLSREAMQRFQEEINTLHQ